MSYNVCVHYHQLAHQYSQICEGPTGVLVWLCCVYMSVLSCVHSMNTVASFIVNLSTVVNYLPGAAT